MAANPFQPLHLTSLLTPHKVRLEASSAKTKDAWLAAIRAASAKAADDKSANKATPYSHREAAAR